MFSVAGRRSAWLPLLGALALTVSFRLGGEARGAAGTAQIDFERDVRPILAENCLGCHGTGFAAGGLKLTDRDAVLAATKRGHFAVVAGKPDASELMRRVTAQDPAQRMPQGKDPLSPGDIEKLRRWIADGAPWREHWGYLPLGRFHPPAVERGGWARNDIDRFVLARLEQQHIAPSPEADRATLIKRLAYDLIGLPPSIGEVDAFVADGAPDAYDRLVDRLLQSPHFGERWGRHWLDMAHYADSDGYEKDNARPDAYLYRDWVIEAINRDLPFDRFTIEQLAGDLLPGAGARQRIAAAFNRQTLTNEEGGVDQEEFRIAASFDRTASLGTVWLGLTVGCARCHDHKYDPIRQREYYRLFAFFNESDEVSAKVPVEAAGLAELERDLGPLEQALAARRAELAPQELAWEAAQHVRIMAQPATALAEQPLELLRFESSAAAKPATVEHDLVVPAGPAKDRYELTTRAPVPEIIGFKLWVLPDDSLPGKGPGRATDGNLVLTGFSTALVADNQPDQPIALQWAQADYTQKGFSADAVLPGGDKPGAGWAVGGRTGQAHWIQFLTHGPLRIPEGARLRIVLDQQHGAGHTIGRFRVAALTGRVRELEFPKAVADGLETYPEKRVAKTRALLFDHFVTRVLADEPALGLRRQIDDLVRRHNARMVEVRTLGTPLVPRTTHVFHRGDFLSPEQDVAAGTPAILPPLRARSKIADRLDLANWLVAPDNFTTPRVAVNQVWKNLFGEGLVRTIDDFGVRGEAPSHPELLDWLAGRFHGDLAWSRKALIRLIVTSATYRQSSRHRPELAEIDPGNRLLYRQNRFRVESEVVRDLHLAAAGLLSPKIGGPSVFPPMPEDLAKLSYAGNFSWTNSAGEERYRRGLYTFFKRTVPHPNLMTFDSPDANVACVRRTVSNTPLQALTLLNNEVHAEAAQGLARRVLSGAPRSDGERLTQAVRLCIARPPGTAELDALRQVLEAGRRFYAVHPDDAGRLVGTQAPADIPCAEAAAWVAAVRVVLNMDEFITRE